MNESKVLTLAEHEAETERVAVARAACKIGRYPSARQVAEERAAMESEAQHGKDPFPKLTATDAAAWLKARGLTVPPKNPPPKQ